jgi:mRNA-degrading endonuclease RelE of RelBE toxin-antitoxin system
MGYAVAVSAWTVTLKESVIGDLRALGRKAGRAVLKAAVARLAADPLAEARHMKTLRPNPMAQRELRLLGKYRVLFVVEREARRVIVVLVGEKRGNTLLVQGRRFAAHHESHPAE